MTRPGTGIDFWFSIGSTYTYLAAMRLPQVAQRTGIAFRWRPFDVRSIMVEQKNLPFTAAPGSPARWKRTDGEAFEVSMEDLAPGFALSFRQDDVVRIQRFGLSEDGRTLTLDVTLRHPKVPEPVRYRLVYRKAG